MILAMMWERYRAQMDLSLREAELSRAHREELHLRELELLRSGDSRRRIEHRSLERSAGWLMRAARAAASWVL